MDYQTERKNVVQFLSEHNLYQDNVMIIPHKSDVHRLLWQYLCFKIDEILILTERSFGEKYHVEQVSMKDLSDVKIVKKRLGIFGGTGYSIELYHKEKSESTRRNKKRKL